MFSFALASVIFVVLANKLVRGKVGSCERGFSCETLETYLDPPL